MIPVKSILLSLLACHLSVLFAATESRIAIVGAKVFDGTSAEPRVATVLIKGEKIEAVGTDVKFSSDYSVIDARGMTLLPGFFDLHTHLSYSAGRGIEGDFQRNLRAYLYCGVTTVVDFGTYPETFEPTRRLIKEGKLLSPRLLRAARFSTPGGHGAEGGRGDFTIEVTTPAEAVARLRGTLRHKPDAIKVFTDGWRYGSAPDMTSMRRDTLEALVNEAHAHRIPVLTHTVTLEKAKIAALAGVDVIAHGVSDKPVDAELIRSMQQKGTAYAPTLAVYEPRPASYQDELLAQVQDPAVRNSTRPRSGQPLTGNETRSRRWELLLKNNRSVHQAGIRFGTGTDAGVTGTYHGWATLRELKLLVEGGLSPLDTLAAATGNSATALRLDAERGFIKPGLLADLILVAGEPHRDITEIMKINRVYLGGKELNRSQLSADIAQSEPLTMPTLPAVPKVDDFERDGFSTLTGSRWISRYDVGHDHSTVSYARILRRPGDHALSVHAVMAHKPEVFVHMVLPLAPGGMAVMNASRFKGISFLARGEGRYRLQVENHSIRDSDKYGAAFDLTGAWQQVRVPFATLRRNSDSSRFVPADLLALVFEIARPPGGAAWLELDDVGFYSESQRNPQPK